MSALLVIVGLPLTACIVWIAARRAFRTFRIHMAARGDTTVRLRLTRDSVCPAEDVDAPHERDVEVPSFADPAVLVTALLGYLPGAPSPGHSWTCALNGTRIATIEGNGRRVRPEARVQYAASNHVHFSYATARENGNTHSDRSSE